MTKMTKAQLVDENIALRHNIDLLERVTLPEATLKELIDRTAFAMAHQDVRYYLNGTLLDLREQALRCVATDGHRLALAQAQLETDVPSKQEVILPRKTVIEFRKHFGWYTKGLHGASELRQRLFQVESIAEAEEIFVRYLAPLAQVA